MENEDTTELMQNDWLEIQSASSTNEARWYKNENSVVINECFFTDSAVLAPSNHEDLPIDSLNQKEQVEGQSEVFPSSASGDHNAEVEVGKVEKKDGRWIRMLCLGFLSSAIGKIVPGRMTQAAVFRGRIWWFASATTGVGALALVVVLCRRARRRQRKLQPERKHHLMLLIKSKDEKISELLLQISLLNDMLLARRRVPVLQVR